MVCFGKEDTASVRVHYAEAGVKYMLAQLGQSAVWNEVQDFELRMSSFDDELDFDTVYSLLY